MRVGGREAESSSLLLTDMNGPGPFFLFGVSFVLLSFSGGMGVCFVSNRSLSLCVWVGDFLSLQTGGDQSLSFCVV